MGKYLELNGRNSINMYLGLKADPASSAVHDLVCWNMGGAYSRFW